MYMLGALKECSLKRDLAKGMLIHASMTQNQVTSTHLQNALMNMYVKCGCMVDAYRVFEAMQRPSVVSWNVLILGYANNGHCERALEMFSLMGCEGYVPDALSFVAVLKAYTTYIKECKLQNVLEQGIAYHYSAVVNGCSVDDFLLTSVIDMYMKCGSIVDAQLAFDRLDFPDLVALTALIMGYVDNGKPLVALKLFKSLEQKGCKPNALTYIAVLKACINMIEIGMAVHSRVINDGYDSHVKVASTIVDMYAKCKSLPDAHNAFQRIEHPTVVSWTALILGYVENGEPSMALQMFSCMEAEGCMPNITTYLAVLKACTMLRDLQKGKAVHSQIRNHGLDRDNIVLITCLVDFYSKCGSMVDAQQAFDSLHKNDVDLVAWNALMGGYGLQGDCDRVFELFHNIVDSGLQIDGATFLCLLTACSHAGLVDKGMEYFDAMTFKYGIQPTVEHYTCMADLLGRANRIKDAFALIKSMPFVPNEITWTTLLSACREWN